MTLEIRPADMADPATAALLDQLRDYYIEIFGGDDGTPYDAAEFRSPQGQFLVAAVDGAPVATGGWRWHEPPDVVEIKRMFVAPEQRRQGIARRMLTALEQDAAAAGAVAVVLETASGQPEALAMYAGAGYRAVAPFGTYADAPDAKHLGRRLPRGRSA